MSLSFNTRTLTSAVHACFCLLLASCTLIAASGCAQSQIVSRGPIVGAVSDSSARVTVVASSSIALDYATSPDFSQAIRTPALQPNAATHNFVSFDLTGLQPSTIYYLRPVFNNVPSQFTSTRVLTTFPAKFKDSAFTFAFGSCEQQQLAQRRSNVWRLLRALHPILFLQLGDWTYPDRAVAPNFASTDSLIARSYLNKYDPSQGIDSLIASSAVDYVYDDHDYTGNNTDGTAPGKANAIAAYRQYFPHYALPNSADGIYHTFMCGNVQFFVLDLRSERSPDSEAIVKSGSSYVWNPPSGHSILRGTHTTGVDQLRWLELALLASQARWKVIVSSVTWSPAGGKNIPLLVAYANLKHDASKLYDAADTWAGFQEDQDSLMQFIAKYQIRNVVVCSGDVHTAMMDDGKHSVYPEIVSGNLEVPNSNLYGELDSLGFGTTWDRGGQVHDTLNTYGRISVETSPTNRLHCEIVNERDSVIASMYLADSSNTSNIKMPLTPFPAFGVKIEKNYGDNLLAVASLEDRVTGEIYIADERGVEVKRVADGIIDPGSWRFKLDFPQLPSGNYFFVLQAGNRKWSAPFQIVR